MFGFLLNLFNSDLDNNRENDRDEELNRSAIEIWQKDMITKMKIFGIIS